jgi:hypothetical protein
MYSNLKQYEQEVAQKRAVGSKQRVSFPFVTLYAMGTLTHFPRRPAYFVWPLPSPSVRISAAGLQVQVLVFIYFCHQFFKSSADALSLSSAAVHAPKGSEKIVWIILTILCIIIITKIIMKKISIVNQKNTIFKNEIINSNNAIFTYS